MSKPTRCPMARMARGGRCLGPGCNHFAGLRSKVCACCMARLGPTTSRKVANMRRLCSWAALDSLETEALASLTELGPAHSSDSRGGAR